MFFSSRRKRQTRLQGDWSSDVCSSDLSISNCYLIDQFEMLRPVFMKVIEYGRAMGLDMIQGDHEDAPGQLELNFKIGRASCRESGLILEIAAAIITTN